MDIWDVHPDAFPCITVGSKCKSLGQIYKQRPAASHGDAPLPVIEYAILSSLELARLYIAFTDISLIHKVR